MSAENPIIPMLARALTGNQSHVTPEIALEGISLTSTGHEAAGANHTVWQIISHLNYWWEICFGMLENQPRPSANSASLGWTAPKAPGSQAELESGCHLLINNTQKAILLLKDKPQTLAGFEHTHGDGFQFLQSVASHQSYHLGQIVLLRQIAGDWPPPSGGETW